MQGHKICEKYVKIVGEMNRIKAGNTLTEIVLITVKYTKEIQRNSLSSILFNLVMDEIIKNMKDIEVKCSMENNTCKYYAMRMMQE
jgi:hypothetical protein